MSAYVPPPDTPYVPPRPDAPHEADVAEAAARATWRWWEVIALTLGGFVLGSVASIPVFIALGGQASGRMDGAGAAAAAFTYLVLAATLLVWLQVAHKGWWRAVGWPTRGKRLRETAVGVGLGLVSQVGVTAFAALATFILATLAGTSVEVPPQVQSTLTGWEAVALVVYAVIVAPPTEELIFRGLLYHSVADRHGFWAGASGLRHPVRSDPRDPRRRTRRRRAGLHDDGHGCLLGVDPPAAPEPPREHRDPCLLQRGRGARRVGAVV